MKTILVTGGLGFIGTNFVKYLLDNHSDIKVVNVDKETYASNIEIHRDCVGEKYDIWKGDIGNKSLLTRLLKRYQPKAIINFAAESHVDNSISDPSPFIQTNVFGTFNLLECSKEYYKTNKDFKFIHISTDEVYGSLNPHDPAFTEGTSYKPNSPYSASKASSDHLVRAYHHTYGLPTITTNCSNNYGPYQHKEKFIPTIIRNCVNGTSIPVYGDGENIRDWLYVEDHCKAIDLILERGRVGETYNIGGDCERNNLFVVNLICGIMDLKRPLPDDKSYADLITHIEDRPGHDRRYAINFSKIKNELGWKPEETFLTGLSKTIDYYITNENRI